MIELSSGSDSESSLAAPSSPALEINTNELGAIKKHNHVFMEKKNSIFKSRSINHRSKKQRTLYKHTWGEDEERGSGGSSVDSKSSTDPSPYDDVYYFENAPLCSITRSTFNDYQMVSGTSVKCLKNEIRESQKFNDDIEYILDALKDNNPIGIRCLSAITFATKCMEPAFRMHVRAHGVLAKFFKALHDAAKHQSLGLCTALVMFVLSQDLSYIDSDRNCLELMVSLLESDVSYNTALKECGLSAAQLCKNEQKIKELCVDIQSQGYTMHLNLDNITVGQLAIETLLSLTSKRAGERFKEELRELGGLKHIIETVCECCRQISDYVVIWTDQLLDKLRIVDRCMRVLENITQNNEHNQTYLLLYNNGILLDTLVKLYRLCDTEIPLYPSTDITDKDSIGFEFREALLVTLKVLINLTHHFNKKSNGSALIGKKFGIIDTSLHLLIQVPHYIPEQKKFELKVLVLMLLINLIQVDDNKKLLLNAKSPANFENIFSCDKSALEILVKEFNHCEKLAKKAEKKTDAILDGKIDSEFKTQLRSRGEFIEETVTKLLEKAGIHMEYTCLASYIAILIGFLIMNNADNETNIRKILHGHNFNNMLDILKNFFSFMCLTTSTEASINVIRDTHVVIKYMEECDRVTVFK